MFSPIYLIKKSFYLFPAEQLDELFVSFEEKPQGAASLAQVHRAVLANGTTVAVKVQHPKVKAQSSKDIVVMEVSAERERWLIHPLCHSHKLTYTPPESRVLFTTH